jgi:prepilin-type N-terminal cleavage/methylation domain-containing protein
MAPARRVWVAGLQRGFSLLELLVTLIVIVLITSMVTLNVGSGSRDIQLESQLRNLSDVATYALDEAQMLGVDYGLVLYQVSRDGQLSYAYSWRERRPEGWREPESGKDVFAAGEFEEYLDIQLELEGLPVAELVLDDSSAEATPQIIFYSSGEVSAGALDVRRRDAGELLWRLEWDLLGRFSLLLKGEALEDS